MSNFRRTKTIEVDGHQLTISDMSVGLTRRFDDAIPYEEMIKDCTDFTDEKIEEMSPYFIEKIGQAIFDFTYEHYKSESNEESDGKK